jgi:hypothetical protein
VSGGSCLGETVGCIDRRIAARDVIAARRVVPRWHVCARTTHQWWWTDRKVFRQEGSNSTLSSPSSFASASCLVTPGRCTSTSSLCGYSSTPRAHALLYCLVGLLPAASLRRSAWRLPTRLWIMWLANHAVLRLPPPGFIFRQQGTHAKDAAAVPDADVGAGKGWCSRRRRMTTTCR